MREKEAGCLCLREAKGGDLAAIVRLERYLFPPEIAFGRDRWHYLLERARGKVWLLHDARGELMAYLCVLEHRGWQRLVVQTLGVHWRLSRKGWGRWLMMRLIEWAREQGWRSIRLEVSERNEEGLGLYASLDFHQVALLRDYYGPRHHGQRRVLVL